MLTLLHGENIQTSRVELVRLKSSFVGKEVRLLDGRGLDITTIKEATESSSLFGGDVVVVIEQLFSKLGRKTKSIEEYAAVLVESAKSCEIIAWEDKQMSPTIIKSFGSSAVIRQFDLPKIIFQFLDAIGSGHSKILLDLFHQAVAIDAPELIFSMIVSRVRQLIMMKDRVVPPSMQSWQAGRLTNQSKLFTMEKLIAMHTYLLHIETSIKGGTSPFTLTQHIEQLLVDI